MTHEKLYKILFNIILYFTNSLYDLKIMKSYSLFDLSVKCKTFTHFLGYGGKISIESGAGSVFNRW